MYIFMICMICNMYIFDASSIIQKKKSGFVRFWAPNPKNTAIVYRQ